MPPRTGNTAMVCCSAARCRITTSSSSIRRAISGIAAQCGGNFFEALVQCGGAFEIESFACRFAFALEIFGERGAGGFERFENAADFHVVFLFGAAGEARREAHFHFRINAAGKIGIAADFDLAAANLEEVEKAFAEIFGEAARGEWPEIKSFVAANAAGDVAARIIDCANSLSASREGGGASGRDSGGGNSKRACS